MENDHKQSLITLSTDSDSVRLKFNKQKCLESIVVSVPQMIDLIDQRVINNSDIPYIRIIRLTSLDKGTYDIHVSKGILIPRRMKSHGGRYIFRVKGNGKIYLDELQECNIET